MSCSHLLFFICVLVHFGDLPANIDVSWFWLTKPTWVDGSQRASCRQEARICWIESAVWKALLRTIWPVSRHLSHISSSALSIQAGEKHPSWPMRRSPQMGKAAHRKVPPAHPWHLSPLGFIILSSPAKCFSEIKTGCVNEWPQKEILPLVFCRSHGLIHYPATGSEQRHLWAPLEVCIQIPTKKFKGRRFFQNLREQIVAEGLFTRTCTLVCLLLFCLSSITDEAYYHSWMDGW